MLLGGLAVAGLAAGLLPLSPAAAFVPEPAFWPVGEIETTAFTYRMEGEDRYGTAAAIAFTTSLNLNRDSGYPFEQVDRGIFSRGDDDDPANTYGVGVCPETVHVAAGDNSADALAASGVKGITNLPLPGAGVLTNVTNAVVLLTNGNRPTAGGNPAGAVLNPDARDALLEIQAACENFNAVVLGGVAAIGNQAFNEVAAIATLTARVDGSVLAATVAAATDGAIEIPLDRYATAAELALLLYNAGNPGTIFPPVPGDLPDITVFDGGDPLDIYADAVFLARGDNGADALAVSPVAAYYSAPMLLTRPDSLPTASIVALSAMNPRSILVLGGEAAVSQEVVDAAVTSSLLDPLTQQPLPAPNFTPDVLRFAGADRYETSVVIAEQLTAADGADGQLFGFANGVSQIDALPGGAFLDNVSLNGVVAPIRQAPPIERNGALGGDIRGATIFLGGDSPQGEIVPMLLVSGGATLPGSVAAYLEDQFGTDAGDSPAENEVTGDFGFGYVFGGPAAVPDTVEVQVATLLSAGTYQTQRIDGNLRRYNGITDIDPTVTVNDFFFTDLAWNGFGGALGLFWGTASTDGGGVDLNPALVGQFFAPTPQICVYRNGQQGVARMALYGDDFIRSLPVDYQNKPESPWGTAPRSVWVPFESRFMCIDATFNGDAGFVWPAVPVPGGASYLGGALLRFQSLSGNETLELGAVIQTVQDQLSLGRQGINVLPAAGSTWCFAPQAAGSSQQGTARWTLIPGVSVPVPGIIGIVGFTNVANNYRGLAPTAGEAGTLELSCTRRGVDGQPAPTQNAFTVAGTLTFNPVAGSLFPGGIVFNVKGETDLPNIQVPGALQGFSGMYTVGTAGGGPTGGFAVFLQNLGAPAPNLIAYQVMGNA